MKRKGWIGIGVAVVLVGGGSALFFHKGDEEVHWRTAKVDKGNITSRISATGTLNSLIQVPVGTQVSGVVTGLYADFNSLVKKGQVIGTIDETPWRTNLKDAMAGLQRAQDSYNFAKTDYQRYRKLWESKLVDDNTLDSKSLALKTAEGTLTSAKANVEKARTDLGYCTLRAPVDGVVVARLVDVGQTVAASFSTPNMFTIAQDLSKMKVQAAIDEADIGQVKVGQRAFFTVDSYPDRQFQGVVSEVQLNPVITQNVVTYNVVMEVTNERRNAPAEGGEQGGSGGGMGHRGAGEQGGHPGMGSGHPMGGERHPRSRPGADGQRPGGFPRHGAAPQAGPAPHGTADIETNTARYIPSGSPIYKGEYALFPGMTANCTIITERREDVVRVPSAALRFNPATFLKDSSSKPPMMGAPGGSGQNHGGGGQKPQGTTRGMVARREDRVWVLVNGKPKPIPVKTGATDGMFTEVSGEGIQEGTEVITGVEDLKKTQQPAAATPFGGPGMRR
jgi:RND family efflux transporter MFP subunit